MRYPPKSRLLLILLVITLGCDSKTDDNAMQVGVILPLTGDVATYGTAVRDGLEIAIENESSIKLDFQDSRADKRTAIDALELLVFRGVQVFIGDATSTVTYEIGPRIQSYGGVLIVPIATGDRIRELGDRIFMISPRNEKQVARIIQYIKEEYPKLKVGCLYKQNDYGVNIASTFLAAFESDVPYSRAYQDGQDDFRTSLLGFKSESVEVVFLPGNYEETALILRQSHELDYHPVFIGTDGAYSPRLIDLASARNAEGFRLTIMPVNQKSKLYQEFAAAFGKKFGREPDIFSAYGYESGRILIQAATGVESFSPSKIAVALRDSEFDSLTGPLRFVNDPPERLGYEADRQYQMYVVRQGKFVPEEFADK